MAKKKSSSDNNIMVFAVVAGFSLVVGLFAGYMIAKVRYTTRIGAISEMLMQKSDDVNRLSALKAFMMQNGVIMENGKMMAVKDSVQSPMTQTMTMNNGTKVMPNGKVIAKDGSVSMMQNGWEMTMDGKLVPLEGTLSQ